jgi:hypothetical protein
VPALYAGGVLPMMKVNLSAYFADFILDAMANARRTGN